MALSPPRGLPARSQERVLNHFTTIASELHPRWLVKGIVAAGVGFAPALDAVSVHRWFSLFTTRERIRRVGLADCAALLHFLAQPSADGWEVVLAKRGVAHRVGVLLRAGDSAAGLAGLPRVIAALQKGDLFFSHLFSRACRVLLDQVEKAPWDPLLPAFAAAADEFTRRPHAEAYASVFPDVWELLRARVLNDAGESLRLEDVLTALNGFAGLDVEDRPLFRSLVHRLWAAYTERAETPTREPENENATKSVSESRSVNENRDNSANRNEYDTENRNEYDTENRNECDTENRNECDTENRNGNEVVVQPTAANLPAHLGDWMLRGLSPSALAVLAATLLGKGAGDDVDGLLPWTLLYLRRAADGLYPVDLLLVLPALLRGGTATPGRLLHAAYDACRSHFFLIFHDADGGVEKVDSDETPNPEELARWEALRNDMAPRAKASIRMLPSRRFAPILTELTNSGIRDPVVAAICAKRICTLRVCREILPIHELVQVCMALCFQFPPPTPTADSLSPGEFKQAVVPESDHKSDAPPAHNAANTENSSSPTVRFMTVVLNALWNRTDELEARDIHALIGCLQHYYGEKVDEDFLKRLKEQQNLLRSRQSKKKEVHNG
ncbi:unnamed protein product [Phytomonas sp. Hart1]|nr:unnamed protein product [Phytomonas sp. Hart1]|eukprot:CCW71329.1 unnamed protein product [Phytomonas sp. isolate Hart1]